MFALKRLFGTTDEILTWVHVHGLRILVTGLVALLLVRLLRLLTSHILAIAGGTREVAREQQLRTLLSVINSSVTAVIFTIAGLQILQQLDIPVGPLIAGAGVAGLAVGFGAQTLVKDVITGFFVLLDDQFRVGDTIQAAGVQGRVERLTLRQTVLRDQDGTLHFIPNSELKVVSNKTRDWTLASLPVTVRYGADSDRVIQVLRDAAAEVRRLPALREVILADPVVPGIERISGDEVEYLIQIQTVPSAQPLVLRELRARVKEHLEQAGIEH